MMMMIIMMLMAAPKGGEEHGCWAKELMGMRMIVIMTIDNGDDADKYLNDLFLLFLRSFSKCC